MPAGRYRLKMGTHTRFEGMELKTYKPGDIMEVYDESELAGNPVRWELVGESAAAAQREAAVEELRKELKFRIVRAGDDGQYNVINVITGKPVNDSFLSVQEAIELLDRGIAEEKEEEVKEEEVKPPAKLKRGKK